MKSVKDIIARDAFVEALGNPRVEDKVREKNQPRCDRLYHCRETGSPS